MCIQDRICKLITINGLNQNSFSKAIGIQPQTLHHIVAGRRTNPSFEVIQKIIMAFPNINPVWLITGAGEVLLNRTEKKEDGADSERKEKVKYDCDNETLQNASENTLTYSRAAVSLIPIIELSAAAWPDATDKSSRNLTDKLCFPTTIVKKDRAYRCIRIQDESMAPTLTENTYLIVGQVDPLDWADQPDNEIYVLADTEGSSFIRRIKRLPAEGLLACRSDNADKLLYPDFTLSPDQIATLWRTEWFLSTRTPGSNGSYFQRLAQVEDKLDQMQSELSKLKGKKKKKGE